MGSTPTPMEEEEEGADVEGPRISKIRLPSLKSQVSRWSWATIHGPNTV